ncbi:MAG: response regulator [Proteobacteria bacterium]|nr:response regulator [Pseudomonadota bacterium]
MIRSVLIVDDSRLARMMVAGLIAERWPTARMRETESAEQALVAVAQEAPDLIILDHSMPGEAGLDAVEKLQASAPRAQIALVTANIQNTTRRRAADAGCHFVAKPVTAEKIDKLLADLGAGP